MCVLKVGSRGSALALRQTQTIVKAVERLNPGVQCRVEIIKTTGDRISEQPPAAAGGGAAGPLSRSIADKGLFVKEIEAALVAGKIDFAVHSAKDIPSQMDERLCIAAFPKRECPADVLVYRASADDSRFAPRSTPEAGGLRGALMGLPKGARVGTSSPRRRAQLLAVRPDLQVLDLRGNLDTRLRKLDEGVCDALVIASAGLVRMGLLEAGVSESALPSDSETRIELLPYEICLPAVGQGALAVQCKTGDPVCEAVAKLDFPETRACVTAERALLAGLGGGCQTPIAALARVDAGELTMDALVAAVDGTSIVRKSATGRVDEPDELGGRLAEELLRSPAKELLDAACSGVWPNMGAA